MLVLPVYAQQVLHLPYAFLFFFCMVRLQPSRFDVVNQRNRRLLIYTDLLLFLWTTLWGCQTWLQSQSKTNYRRQAGQGDDHHTQNCRVSGPIAVHDPLREDREYNLVLVSASFTMTSE